MHTFLIDARTGATPKRTQSHEVGCGRVFSIFVLSAHIVKPGHQDTDHLCSLCNLSPLYIINDTCVRSLIQCRNTQLGQEAAAGGGMSIYNLEHSHLIVFDRRSPQINKSSRQPQMCTCKRTTRRQPYKHTHTRYGPL